MTWHAFVLNSTRERKKQRRRPYRTTATTHACSAHRRPSKNGNSPCGSSTQPPGPGENFIPPPGVVRIPPRSSNARSIAERQSLSVFKTDDVNDAVRSRVESPPSTWVGGGTRQTADVVTGDRCCRLRRLARAASCVSSMTTTSAAAYAAETGRRPRVCRSASQLGRFQSSHVRVGRSVDRRRCRSELRIERTRSGRPPAATRASVAGDFVRCKFHPPVHCVTRPTKRWMGGARVDRG